MKLNFKTFADRIQRIIFPKQRRKCCGKKLKMWFRSLNITEQTSFDRSARLKGNR